MYYCWVHFCEIARNLFDPVTIYEIRIFQDNPIISFVRPHMYIIEQISIDYGNAREMKFLPKTCVAGNKSHLGLFYSDIFFCRVRFRIFTG